jgi:hypothetical protein
MPDERSSAASHVSLRRSACASSELTDVTLEPDWDYADGESYVAGVYPVVTYAPGYLRCNVCGLELDGEDELRAVTYRTHGNLRMSIRPISTTSMTAIDADPVARRLRLTWRTGQCE